MMSVDKYVDYSNGYITLFILSFGLVFLARTVQSQCLNAAYPTPPKYALPDGYSNTVGSTITYYCAAHFVSSQGNRFQRKAGTISCSAGNVWISSFVDCEPASCYPPCTDEGRCVCGRYSCRCECNSPYSGVDCSVDMSQLPRWSDLILFYPFSDPHFIAVPEKSPSDPWVFDFSGNRRHGRFRTVENRRPFLLNGPMPLTPVTQKFTSMSFGEASLGPAHGYVEVVDASYFYGDLTVNTTSKHTIMYIFDKKSNDDSVHINFKHATNAGIMLTADATKAYLRYTYSGTYQPLTLNSVFQTDDATMMRFEIDSTGTPAFRGAANFGALQSVNLPGGSLGAANVASQGFYIGINMNNPALNSPMRNFLAGRLSSFAIFKGTGYTSTDEANFQNFIQSQYGSDPTYTLDTISTLVPCNVPPNNLNYGIPVVMLVNLAIAATINYHSVPFYMSGTSRTLTATCTATGWTKPAGFSQTTLSTCNPLCQNFATCLCTPVANQVGPWPCQCLCPTGYVGADCSIRQASLSTFGTNIGFWPFNSDSVQATAANSFEFVDLSTQSNEFIVGNTALNGGTFSGGLAQHTGVYLNEQRGGSYLRLKNAASISISSSTHFTILFYYKFTRAPTATEAMPLFTFTSPAGSPLSKSSWFFDDATGLILYQPDQAYLHHEGVLFTDAWGTWIPAKIAYNATSGMMGTSAFNEHPLMTTPVTIATGTEFFIGYRDDTDVAAEIALGCVGIYVGNIYSPSLAENHGQQCTLANKPQCTGLTTLADAVRGSSSAIVGRVVYYTCFNGYRVGTSSNIQQTRTCQLSSGNMKPTWTWNPSSSTACQVATACLPTCSNGGTCVTSASPPKCQCATGFGGVDCSIHLAAFPTKCNLVGLWPLTSLQIDSSGKAVDIINPSTQSATLSTTTLFFPENGPNATPTFNSLGVVEISASTAAQAIKMTFNPVPFQMNAPWTISAYVRFGPTASWSQMYPFVAFKPNDGVGHSPVIYLDPWGVATLKFTAMGATQTVTFDLPAASWIGVGMSWKFVSFTYDSFTGQLRQYIDGVAGAFEPIAVVADNTPVFNTKELSVGTSYIGADNKWIGSIGCLSIYNWALSSSEVVQLQAACSYVLGGTLPSPLPAATCNACQMTHWPNAGYSMPDSNQYMYAAGSTVTFTSAAFTQFQAANPTRTAITQCQTDGTWTTLPSVLPYTRACDPKCQNNGLCTCTPTTCSCVCIPNFTGNDCAIPLTTFNNAPAMASAYWPLSIDTVSFVAGNSLPVAQDISGKANHLTVSPYVSLTNGPWSSTPKSAFRFRNGHYYGKKSGLRGTLTDPNSFVTPTQPVLMLFYFRLNARTGDQPLFGYETPASASQCTNFAWDESVQLLSHTSGGVTVMIPKDNAGPLFPLNNWYVMMLQFNIPTQVNRLMSDVYTQTFGAVWSTAVNYVQSTVFQMGYENSLDQASDVALACVALYANTTVANPQVLDHGRTCSRSGKKFCTNPTASLANMVAPTYARALITTRVFYYCFAGFAVGATSARNQAINCANGPTTFNPANPMWSGALTACTAATAGNCKPGCLNGGTCQNDGSGNFICSCVPPFVGPDCAVHKYIFPDQCHLVSVFPLTTNYLDRLGDAIDLMANGRTASFDGSSTLYDWQTNIPFSQNYPTDYPFAIASLARSNAGGVEVIYGTKTYAFESASSFTISAYIRFEVDFALYTTLYPLVTFASSFTTESPALYIAPNGAGKFYYKYASTVYSIDVALPSSQWIGIEPWAFVSFNFNAADSTLELSLNNAIFSDLASVTVKPQFDTTKMYIGSSVANNQVFPGQIACLTIYKTSLSRSDLTQLKAACDSIHLMGGPAYAPPNLVYCSTCLTPPPLAPVAMTGGYALLTTNDVDWPVGSSIAYRSPPYWAISTTIINRDLVLTCSANQTWSSTSVSVFPQASAVFCDPLCINGYCQCTTTCTCVCFAGYTGTDCQFLAATLNVLGSIQSFWPLTLATSYQISGSHLVGRDFGSNNNFLYYDAAGVGTDTGPFGTSQTALRIRSQRISPIILGKTGPIINTVLTPQFTMIFYLKYNQKSHGHQPMVTFGSTAAFSQFWLNIETGDIIYLPDNVQIPSNSTSNPINSPEIWHPVVISYSAGKMSSSTFDSVPDVAGGIAVSAPNGLQRIAIGHSNFPVTSLFSDISISCLAVYSQVYSQSLAHNHGKWCQQFAQERCSTAPVPSSNFYIISAWRTLASYTVTYSCYGGYWWDSGINAQSQTLTCTQSNSLLPTLSWSPSAVTGQCVESPNDCQPSCKNGAFCRPQVHHASCECSGDYVGYDCDIDFRMIPAHCNLVALWPLTSNHVNPTGQLIDIGPNHQHGLMMNTSSSNLAWPQASFFGVDTYAVPNFVGSSTKAVSVTLTSDFLQLGSFTVSAYVQFDLTATISYSTVYYPLLAFSNNTGLTSSPGIFISPNGNARMYYVASSAAQYVNFNLGASFIGVGNWAFVSVAFTMVSVSSFTNPRVQINVLARNGATFVTKTGSNTITSPPPVFTGNNNTLFIGSTDMEASGSYTTVFPGRIACVSIYKSLLSVTELQQLYEACNKILGGPTPTTPIADQSACNICQQPPGAGLSLPSRNDVNYVLFADDVETVCPAFTRSSNDKFKRWQSTYCSSSNTWVDVSLGPIDVCDITLSPVQCDPTCLNGGQCHCNRTTAQCFCLCQPGFTGPDCLYNVNRTQGYQVDQSAIVFWPLTSDTTLRDLRTNWTTLITLDYAGTNYHLKVGAGVGVAPGVWSMPARTFGAMRFRSLRSKSYLWLENPAFSLGGPSKWNGTAWQNSSLDSYTVPAEIEPFVIIFYLNYYSQSFGNQPIISWSNGGASFWIDQLSGKIRYYPDDILLPYTGTVLGSIQSTWTAITIVYQADGTMGVAEGFGNSPTSFVAVSDVPTNMTEAFFLGYSDYPSPKASDIGLACLAIYRNVTFSTSLQESHGQVCRMFTKRNHTIVTPTLSGAYPSLNFAFSGQLVNITCFAAGRVMPVTQKRSDQVYVQLSSSLDPVQSWSSPLPGNIGCSVNTTSCNPPCKNNGTCTPSAIAPYCACPPEYLGVDCSIPAAILPCQSHMLGYWPLVHHQVDINAKPVDLWTGQKHISLTSPDLYTPYYSPFYPNGSALFTVSSLGNNQFYVPNLLWPSVITSIQEHFLVTAFVRFDPLATATTPNIFYPLVVIGNPLGTSARLAIFINKAGRVALCYYASAMAASKACAETSAGDVIGTVTPLSFVVAQYNATTQAFRAGTLTYDTQQLVYGPEVVLPSAPYFTYTAGRLNIGNNAGFVPTNPAPTLLLSETFDLNFKGEIACLSFHNSTLPPYQTTLLLAACLPNLGGPMPEVTPAHQLCTEIPQCIGVPTIPHATLFHQYPHPPVYMEEVPTDHYTNATVLVYICDYGYTYLGSIVEQNVTCNMANWDMLYSACWPYNIQTSTLLLEFMRPLSDLALLKYQDNLTKAVEVSATDIPNQADLALITYSVQKAVPTCFLTYQRYFKLSANLSYEGIMTLSHAFGSSIGKLLFAATNYTTLDSAYHPVKSYDGLWKCYDGTTVAPAPRNPLSLDQLYFLYDTFLAFFDIMMPWVRETLVLGETFYQNELFYTLSIEKIKINQLSGLHMHTKYHSIYFPHLNNMDGVFLLADEYDVNKSISTNQPIVAVTYSFLNNILTPEQPHNVMTVSTALYMNNETLSLNPDAPPLRIEARPLVPKAKLFATQKQLAQCNVNKIQCSLKDNADRLATYVVFVLAYDAGPFLLMFPATREDFTFTAYIHFNTQPAPENYIWKFKVQLNADGSREVSLNGGSSGVEQPSYFLDSEHRDTRLLIPVSAIRLLGGLSSEKPTGSIQVLLRRDYSKFSAVDDLPSTACDLQPCYGYHLKVSTTGVSRFNRKKRVAVYTKLNEAGLTLDPSSNEDLVLVRATQFGDYGIAMAITPNRISFVDVFAKFSVMEYNDIPVLIFMIATVLFFGAGLLFAHHLDKLDLKQWSFMPSISNAYFQNINYLISVHYRKVKHIYLKPCVSVSLHGEIQDTAWRHLRDHTRPNYESGNPENFVVTTFLHTGNIQGIEIKVSQAKWGSVLSEIYVERIIVVDPESQWKYIFNVDRLIRAGDEPVFLEPSKLDFNSLTTLIGEHSSGSLNDEHLWLSLLKRPYPSRWTRTERLGCLVSGIFLCMLANIMFYGKEYASPRVGLIMGRYLRVSWFSVWTTCFSTVFVAFPVSIIALFFRLTPRRSAEMSHLLTIFNIKSSLKSRKSSGRLPYECVYVGWILVILCILGSSFFVVLYSLQWGFEKSLQWLTSMILHLIIDFAMVQICKTLIIAFHNALSMKFPEDGIELEIATHVKQLRSHIMKFRRFRYALYDFAHHFIFVAAFWAVIMTCRQSDGYFQQKAVADLIKPAGYHPIKSVLQGGQVFQWLQNELFPKLSNGIQFQNHFAGSFRGYSPSAYYAVPNHDLLVFSPIRLRQHRVSPVKCPIEASANPLVNLRYYTKFQLDRITCHESFIGNSDSSDRRVFDGRFILPFSPSYDDYLSASGNPLPKNFTPWYYQSTKGPQITGWTRSFDQGGFLLDLRLESLAEIQNQISSLQRSRWLDNYTSFFVVELLITFPYTNTYIPTKVIFEPLESGGFIYHLQAYILDLYQYVGFDATQKVLAQFVWILVLLTHIAKVLYRLVTLRPLGFVSSAWNFAYLIQISLCTATVAYGLARPLQMLNLISFLSNNIEQEFISFDQLVADDATMNQLFAVAFFWTILMLLSVATPFTSFIVILRTLSKVKWWFAYFAFILLLWTVQWGSAGALIFGHRYEGFSTIVRGMMTLFGSFPRADSSLLGYDSPYDSYPAVVFVFAYSMCVLLVIGNLFVALLLFVYGRVARTFKGGELSKFIEDMSNFDDRQLKATYDFLKKHQLMRKIREQQERDEDVINPASQLEEMTDRLLCLAMDQAQEFDEEKQQRSLLHWFVETIKHWRAWNQAVRLLEAGWVPAPSQATSALPTSSLKRESSSVSRFTFSAISKRSIQIYPAVDNDSIVDDEKEQAAKWRHHIESDAYELDGTVPKWAQRAFNANDQEAALGMKNVPRPTSSAIREAYLKIDSVKRSKMLKDDKLLTPISAHDNR